MYKIYYQLYQIQYFVMKGKQYASKLWQLPEETEKTSNKKNGNYNTYNTNSQQTYTPRGARDFNYFKGNSGRDLPNINIQRHSSEQEFKLRNGKVQKSMMGDSYLNTNNQESSSKNEYEDSSKIKSYINSTSSTQNSANFFTESINYREGSSPRSPKNTRGEQLNIEHSPTFTSTSNKPKAETLGQQKYSSNTNSNKKMMYKRPQDQYGEVEKNTFAFLHKGNPKNLQSQSKIKKKPNDPNNIFNKNTGQQFKILKKLGQGKFGRVYIVKEVQSGFILAIKAVQKNNVKDSNLLYQLIRQIKIQLFLDHPHIIKVYGFFDDPKYFYVLMELGSHGQLYDLIESKKILTQQSTSFIIKSLLEAVKYMHSHKILHRDIKPQNIVFIHGNVKICDFGWAVNKSCDGLRSTFCGTPLYLSPQILTGNRYDQKVDLWAIGILACQIHLGCTPFDVKDKEDLKKIITDEIKYPKNPSKPISKQFKQFVQNILNKNPKQRMTGNQLLQLTFIRKYEDLQTCQELCK